MVSGLPSRTKELSLSSCRPPNLSQHDLPPDRVPDDGEPDGRVQSALRDGRQNRSEVSASGPHKASIMVPRPCEPFLEPTPVPSCEEKGPAECSAGPTPEY